MDQKEVNLFQSDFRVVADYFVQKRERGDYTPTAQELRHVQETLQLLSVMTGDHRFEEAYDSPKEGGPHNMCEVLDRVEKKGRQAGMQAGMRTGIQQGEDMFALLVKKLLECGRMEDIRRVTEDKDYRQQLMREMHILPWGKSQPIQNAQGGFWQERWKQKNQAPKESKLTRSRASDIKGGPGSFLPKMRKMAWQQGFLGVYCISIT